MGERDRKPAFEGWHTLDEIEPHLIGLRCTECGSYCFPPVRTRCLNPACGSTTLERVQLSRSGRLWSYTDACYQPPEPYLSSDAYQPFAIAAVELERERMIVLGQVARGIGVDRLRVGMQMQLVLEPVRPRESGSPRLIGPFAQATTRDLPEPPQTVIWKWTPAQDPVP